MATRTVKLGRKMYHIRERVEIIDCWLCGAPCGQRCNHRGYGGAKEPVTEPGFDYQTSTAGKLIKQVPE